MSYPPLPPQTQQPGYGPPMAQPYDQQYGQQPGAPQGGEWMAMPMLQVPNCPPVLAYLSTLDQLIVKQQMEILEMFIDFETANKYKIKNVQDQTIFLAAEDTDCCSRNCFGNLRPFDMKIMDNAKNEVIHLNRPLACDACCFPCSRQSMEVSCPPGTVIGSLEKEWSLLTPKFLVKDASGQTVLKIEGPLCTMAMCGTVEFEVLSADGTTQIGKISKNWSGFGREMFTDADTFGISFPMDLDVKIKAVLLGAVFLIDYLYFERSKQQGHRQEGAQSAGQPLHPSPSARRSGGPVERLSHTLQPATATTGSTPRASIVLFLEGSKLCKQLFNTVISYCTEATPYDVINQLREQSLDPALHRRQSALLGTASSELMCPGNCHI